MKRDPPQLPPPTAPPPSIFNPPRVVNDERRRDGINYMQHLLGWVAYSPSLDCPPLPDAVKSYSRTSDRSGMRRLYRRVWGGWRGIVQQLGELSSFRKHVLPNVSKGCKYCITKYGLYNWALVGYNSINSLLNSKYY